MSSSQQVVHNYPLTPAEGVLVVRITCLCPKIQVPVAVCVLGTCCSVSSASSLLGYQDSTTVHQARRMKQHVKMLGFYSDTAESQGKSKTVGREGSGTCSGSYLGSRKGKVGS